MHTFREKGAAKRVSRKLSSPQPGQNLGEWSLVLGLVAIFAILLLGFNGEAINRFYTMVNSRLSVVNGVAPATWPSASAFLPQNPSPQDPALQDANARIMVPNPANTPAVDISGSQGDNRNAGNPGDVVTPTSVPRQGLGSTALINASPENPVINVAPGSGGSGIKPVAAAPVFPPRPLPPRVPAKGT